jgi:hypothetical protein
MDVFHIQRSFTTTLTGSAATGQSLAVVDALLLMPDDVPEPYRQQAMLYVVFSRPSLGHTGAAVTAAVKSLTPHAEVPVALFLHNDLTNTWAAAQGMTGATLNASITIPLG